MSKIRNPLTVISDRRQAARDADIPAETIRRLRDDAAAKGRPATSAGYDAILAARAQRESRRARRTR